jgi:hypothetical protein
MAVNARRFMMGQRKVFCDCLGDDLGLYPVGLGGVAGEQLVFGEGAVSYAVECNSMNARKAVAREAAWHVGFGERGYLLKFCFKHVGG